MVNAATEEVLVNCRFYFEADGITDKMILEVSGLSSETPAAGGDQVLGSGKQAINLRQAAPTQVKFETITIKIVATSNKDLYDWYEDCNKNSGGQSDWTSQRKTASVVVYDQSATEQARWDIDDCYPTKYEGPQLEANSNDTANETITLTHIGIKRVK